MMKKIGMILLLGLFWVRGVALSADAKEIPYTLEDRERLIRLEVKLDEMSKRFEQRFEQIERRLDQIDRRFEQIDKRFEQIDKRFEQGDQRSGQMITLFMGIVAAFAVVVATTIGFAIWDRRTALDPVLKQGKQIGDHSEKLEQVLRSYAEQEPRLADILRRFGLL
jgi:chromosome segregation ATPase